MSLHRLNQRRVDKGKRRLTHVEYTRQAEAAKQKHGDDFDEDTFLTALVESSISFGDFGSSLSGIDSGGFSGGGGSGGGGGADSSF